MKKISYFFPAPFARTWIKIPDEWAMDAVSGIDEVIHQMFLKAYAKKELTKDD